MQKAVVPGNDSSPFQSSPLDSSTSPRLFWQNRNSKNLPHGGRNGSPPSNRRSSIERLQRASRVKNSNLLALEQKQEYDPTRIPHIERPLAKVQDNAYTTSSSPGGLPSSGAASQEPQDRSSQFMMSPSKVSPQLSDIAKKPTRAPSKDQVSPTKSSLSPTKFNKNTFDPAAGTWSGHSSYSETEIAEGRFLRRRPKSVTFDAAPPQINEYEMATPDLSSVGTNSREGSYESVEDDEDDLYDPALVGIQDESFDESLEDTDKTPVVGPDDWRGESPLTSRTVAANKFEGSPMPGDSPVMAASGRTTPTNKRTDSANSNGDHRPLPPLPGMGHARSQSTDSSRASPGLSATAERMLGGSHRSLPAPPPASASKSDIQNIGSHKMTLEERLQLMMLSDDTDAKTAAEQQRERRLRRGNGRERAETPHSEAGSESAAEADDTIGDISGLDFEEPPKISRESIMRRVNGNAAAEEGTDESASSPEMKSQRNRLPNPKSSAMDLDPDVPIPSTEDSLVDEDEYNEEGSVIITRDSGETGYDVLDYYQDDDTVGSYDEGEQIDRQDDFVEQSAAHEDEEAADREQVSQQDNLKLDMPLSELRIGKHDVPFKSPAPVSDPVKNEPKQEKLTGHDAKTRLEPVKRPVTPTRRLSKPEYDGSGWGEPDEEEEYADQAETSGSEAQNSLPDEEERKSPPAIPERIATIKAPGAKLKTRLSNTPSDLAAMREARRHVSQEPPEVPAIPERHLNSDSKDLGAEGLSGQDDFVSRHPSFKNRSLTLDFDMGLSLDQDFERVIEAQKRGYLMRQNTKVITASDKDGDEYLRSRSAQSSPVKNRPESWVVEPWSPHYRHRSTRKRATGTTGAVPPLPGQESNATAINRSSLEDTQSEVATVESGERGRLFVKVMGVKDLDLPMPKKERSWFSLTLDNGVHCVTTAWLELARNAPIGQEFELVVPNDLEFQLTLNVKLEKPAYLSSQPTGKPVKSKTSTFSRVFASPRKRREMEQRQKEEERQQREALARQRSNAPSGYELFSPFAGEDGSFARAYVCLKDHEHHCFGRPYMAEVACFNQWTAEEESFASSVKSKRGNTAATIVRRAPYKIGKLELQLLFVPRPKNSADDDMPKSMNSCVRELKAAEERLAQTWEGHLSQQGGDCPVRSTLSPSRGKAGKKKKKEKSS